MRYPGSRYEFTDVYQATDARGQRVTALEMRAIPPTPAGYYHTVTAGERLDLLAFQYYGNAEKFWLIADANSAMDPEDLLEPGRILRIPPDQT